MTLMTVLAA